ncbi:MAG: hypothetical protein JJ976_16605 [Rhodothermales bacterium]|nr:hypothetical protein [Rhodothermales bacterium]
MLEVRHVGSPHQEDEWGGAAAPDLVVPSRLEVGALAPFFRGVGSGEVLGLSLGARWIFRKPIIDLFQGRLLNAHGSRLPFDKGGGGFSWRIMRHDRIGNVLLHQIDEGIDTGAVVHEEVYAIPRNCISPAEIEQDYVGRVAASVHRLVARATKDQVEYALRRQAPSIGSYYPRLSTDDHGWINWSWGVASITRFVTAFDSPYPGASTFWRGQRVYVSRVQEHCGEMAHHEGHSGIIIRTHPDFVVVAGTGGCLLVEGIRAEDGSDLLSAVREGDRLHTPSDRLDAAMSTRVSYGPSGIRSLT